jgi:hypothetical protein
MSNPTTNYTVNGKDLSNIFQPLTTSSISYATGYTVNGTDLQNIFAKNYGYTLSYNTGYTVSGVGDLRDIFAPYNTNIFTSTSGQLTTTSGTRKTLASDFIMPTSYKNFNFYLYGAGGNGSQVGSGEYGSGGGGAGAFIKAIDIPYSNTSGNIISQITYTIGDGGYGDDTSVTISYYGTTPITIIAGGGKSTSYNNSTAGAAGGISSYSNTTNTYSNSNIKSVNGTDGGNQNASGTSNGYTSSGSGSTNSKSSPVSNNSSASQTYTAKDGNTYTITSKGGGSNQVVSGYGAGGAATPANFNKNATAYRAGSAGVIIYMLS